MSDKNSYSGNISSIPEIIEPGITIPIFDENTNEFDTSHVSPQKIGSYRSKAGRFSNKFSNILPSISAKLHHSKKPLPQDKESINGYISNNSNNGSITSLDPNNTDSYDKEKASIPTMSGVPFGTGLRTSTENERLVQFPISTDSFNPTASVNNNNNLQQHLSRTRNSTMASQYTSLSLHPYNSAGTSNIWPNNSATGNSQQQYINNQNNITLDTIPNVNQASLTPNFDYSYSANTNSYFNVPLMKSTTNYETMEAANIQNQSQNLIWSQNDAARKRSQSMATQVRPDNYYAQAQQQFSMGNMDQSQGMMDQMQFPVQQEQYTANNNISAQPVANVPILLDDVDTRSISWVTASLAVPSINQTNNLSPTNTIAITNIYSLQQSQPQFINAVNLTSTSLAAIFSRYGTIISVRTLRDLNMALVEYEAVEYARFALDSLQEKDLSMIGYPCHITFARILPLYNNSGNKNQNGPLSLLQEQLFNGAIVFQQQGSIQLPILKNLLLDNNNNGNNNNGNTNKHSHNQSQSNFPGMTSNVNNTQLTLPVDTDICPFTLPPPSIQDQQVLLQDVIRTFKVAFDEDKTRHILTKALNVKQTVDMSDFGPTPEPLAVRQFQTPKLREIRKAIDSNSLSDVEIEQIGMAMLDELPELSFDYLGNTIVQKIYDRSSDIVRDIILRKISKYLTSLGIHKSGTWVCQKMIKLAHNARALSLVTDGIRDYCTPLFNDQFGNYVIQEVLKFGVPWNNFIFESILGNFWLICRNKYGARAVRACLEANHIITTEQTLILSAMIVAYGEYLITDNSGTLLITWLLDTCQFTEKYTTLTNKIVTNIAALCCHKLGSLTILKILNSRGNENCRKLILDEIFGENIEEGKEKDANLVKILSDTNYGPTFMYKLLTSRLLDESTRSGTVERIRHIILENNISQQNHKLMEEVGLVSINATNPDRSPMKHQRTLTHSHSMFNPAENGRNMRGLSVSSIRSNGTTSVPVAQPMSSVNTPHPHIPINNLNGMGLYPSNVGYNDETMQQYEIQNLAVPLQELSLNHNITSDTLDVNGLRKNINGF